MHLCRFVGMTHASDAMPLVEWVRLTLKCGLIASIVCGQSYVGMPTYRWNEPAVYRGKETRLFQMFSRKPSSSVRRGRERERTP